MNTTSKKATVAFGIVTGLLALQFLSHMRAGDGARMVPAAATLALLLVVLFAGWPRRGPSPG